jgi:hypothetical protein
MKIKAFAACAVAGMAALAAGAALADPQPPLETFEFEGTL